MPIKSTDSSVLKLALYRVKIIEGDESCFSRQSLFSFSVYLDMVRDHATKKKVYLSTIVFCIL